MQRLAMGLTALTRSLSGLFVGDRARSTTLVSDRAYVEYRGVARADLLVFSSAWVDEEATRVPLLASLARQFDLAVANANWGPGVVVVPGQGDSCILDRRGRPLATVAPGDRRADAVVL